MTINVDYPELMNRPLIDQVKVYGPACSADTTKDTNPKDAVGTKKVPLSVVPLPPLLEIGNAMLEGARKYGRHNYRVAGIRASVYFDACIRHLFAWWEGEDNDPDSGVSHIVKTLSTLIVLRDAMLNEKWEDDRPPRYELGPEWMSALNSISAEVIARHPDARKPVTHLDPTL